MIILIIFSSISSSTCHQTTFREETENLDNSDIEKPSVHPVDTISKNIEISNHITKNENENVSSYVSPFTSIFHSLIPDWIRWRIDYIRSIIRQLRSQDISALINEWMSLSTSEITGINIRSMTTCYDNLGCFPAERNCFSLLFGVQNSVYSLEKINTTFMIFDRINVHPIVLNYDSMSIGIKNVSIDSSMNTFIAVHGFNSGYEASEWLPELKNLILNYTSDNFIAVDWSGGADIFNYQRARANTRVVGAQIARFIQLIGNEFGISPNKVTLIGHSLGAHIMGYAGKRFNQFTMAPPSGNFTSGNYGDGTNETVPYRSVKISNILALDPAGPCFGFNDTSYPVTDRLHSTDAALVEVVHTNGIYGGEGIDIKLGHLDYFPNGGQVQPGCPAPLEVVLMPFRFKELSCSHVRAPELMNAIRKDPNQEFGSCQFVAYECKSRDHFLKGECASCDGAKCQLMFIRELTDAGTLIGTELIKDPIPNENDDDQINTIGNSYLSYLKRNEKTTPSYFLETSEFFPYCLHHYQIIVELNESATWSANGTLSLTLTSKGESPRVGNVNITMTPEDGIGPFTGLMLVPSTNETNGDPGAFTRIAFKYHPNEDSIEKNKVINIKNIRYNYMSDIRQNIRNRLSGSISTKEINYSDMSENEDSHINGFIFPPLRSPPLPMMFPSRNNFNHLYRNRLQHNRFIF